MIEKLGALAERYSELEILIADPEVMRNREEYRKLVQEHAHLQDAVNDFHRYQGLLVGIEDARELIENEEEAELRELAKEELKHLEQEKEELEKRLRDHLVPSDPLDLKNIIMEIRAGTGGEEAALFAADLYRMYSRYSEQQDWKIEILSASPTEIGGFKEVIFSVAGKKVYGDLRFESGTHRVQRVPETESAGYMGELCNAIIVLYAFDDLSGQI